MTINTYLLSSLLVFVCLLYGCKESMPTETISPSDTTRITEVRSWSVPEAVPLFTPEQIQYSAITAFAVGNGVLHMLISVPDDTLDPHMEYSMAYLSYLDEEWILNGSVKGGGIFKPATILSASNGQQHLFWAGIRNEKRAFSQLFDGTDLYHCTWQGDACTEPVSLYMRPEAGVFGFGEAFQDRQSEIHLAFSNGSSVYFLEFPEGGNPNVSLYKASFYPRMVVDKDSLYLVYVGRPIDFDGSNDVYLINRGMGASWNNPINVFHDPSKDAHRPAIAFDKKGNIHVVFYAQIASGAIEVIHLVSSDSGVSWESTLIFEDPDFFAGTIRLIVDESDVMHLTWGVYGTALPFRENYHAMWKAGKWSEPEILFPEIKMSSELFITSDSRNRVYLAFLSGSQLYHVVYE